MKLIKITKGKFAMVDDQDFDLLNSFKWQCKNSPTSYTSYATRSKTHGLMGMHNVIMNGLYVDHIDGNGLNNQRSNLRFATNSENQLNKRLQKNNTLGLKGVCIHNGDRKNSERGVPYYRARVTLDKRKRQTLGLFRCPTMAGAAYNKAAKEIYGEFARLNWMD